MLSVCDAPRLLRCFLFVAVCCLLRFFCFPVCVHFFFCGLLFVVCGLMGVGRLLRFDVLSFAACCLLFVVVVRCVVCDVPRLFPFFSFFCYLFSRAVCCL